MEQHHHLRPEHGDERRPTDRSDIYDNDPGLERPHPDAGHDEYQARIDRTWKHAAWRTEMALRLKALGHRPARPDSAF